MSFDLYIFDVDDLPDDIEVISDMLEDEAAWNQPYTVRLQGLVDELVNRFPGLDTEPDASPWASWPLNDSMANGRCAGLNISWSAADSMLAAIQEACARHQLALHDPQTGLVTRPPAVKPSRRWWRSSSRE